MNIFPIIYAPPPFPEPNSEDNRIQNKCSLNRHGDAGCGGFKTYPWVFWNFSLKEGNSIPYAFSMGWTIKDNMAEKCVLFSRLGHRRHMFPVCSLGSFIVLEDTPAAQWTGPYDKESSRSCGWAILEVPPAPSKPSDACSPDWQHDCTPLRPWARTTDLSWAWLLPSKIMS